MSNLYRKVVLFFTVVLKVFKWFLCKRNFQVLSFNKDVQSHIWKSFYVSASQSGKFVWQNSSLAKELLDSVKKKKSAIKLGDWDLKPGGFQNICQIKPRLNYQPLFRKMSPHSSPWRSGWTHAISRLSSGRIKDRTRETAEIKPYKTKKADYFCHGVLYSISCLCCTLLLLLWDL